MSADAADGDQEALGHCLWGAGIADHLPDTRMAEQMLSRWRIQRYHFCRMREEDKPTYLVVMHAMSRNGKSAVQWEGIVRELGMRPAPKTEPTRRRALWRKYGELFGDDRGLELERNVVVLETSFATGGKENHGANHRSAPEPPPLRPAWCPWPPPPLRPAWCPWPQPPSPASWPALPPQQPPSPASWPALPPQPPPSPASWPALPPQPPTPLETAPPVREGPEDGAIFSEAELALVFANGGPRDATPTTLHRRPNGAPGASDTTPETLPKRAGSQPTRPVKAAGPLLSSAKVRRGIIIADAPPEEAAADSAGKRRRGRPPKQKAPADAGKRRRVCQSGPDEQAGATGEEGGPGLDRPGRSSPSLTLTVADVLSPAGAPAISECARQVREFLSDGQHYARPTTGTQSLGHVMLRTLFALVPRSLIEAGLFHLTNATGVMRHFPSDSVERGRLGPQSELPSGGTTLEMHRRVMALELLCSRLVALLGEWRHEGGPTGLSMADAYDATLAIRCRITDEEGGTSGGGGLDESGQLSEFGRLIKALRAGRAAALQRGVLFADHLSWGIPVLLTLFLLRVENKSHNAALIAARMRHLHDARQKAVQVDAALLRRYGWQLTLYATRLTQLAALLRIEVPPCLQMSRFGPNGEEVRDATGATTTLPFEREDPEPTPTHGQRVRETYLQKYQTHVDALMVHAGRHLGLADAGGVKGTPAVLQSTQLVERLRHCMATDSHYDNKTIGLFSTGSLLNAKYDPASYLRTSTEGLP